MEVPEDVSDSPLPWSWVIEALATDPRVDLDCLCAIIEFPPNLPDKLTESAKEMVVLRNLEGLFDPAKVLNDSAPLPSDQEEIQFDSSICCSQVLKCVIDKAPVSSLRKDGSSALRNIRRRTSGKLVEEVRTFLEKKKASLTKCALKELSDILQNGDARPENDLKRVMTCLQTQEGTVDDQICELPPEKKQKHDYNGSVASTEQLISPLILSDMPIDVQLGHDNDGDIASAEQNLAPLISPDLQNCPVDVQSGNKYPENPSTPADSEEINVCIKCGRGGELLVCSVGSCSVVVHERCLGFRKSVDNRGDFLCPYCACSSSNSVYAAAKEKMLLARQMLSLFVGGNPPRPSSDDRIFEGKVKGVDQVHRAPTDEQHKGHLASDDVHTSPPNCPSRDDSIPAKSFHFENRFVIADANLPRQSSDERTFDGKGKGADQIHRASTSEQQKGHLALDDVPENGESLPGKSSLEKRFILVDAKSSNQDTDERYSEDKGVDQIHQASTDELQKQKDHFAPDDPEPSSGEGEDTTEKNCQLEDEEQMMSIEQIYYTVGNHGVSKRQKLNSPSKTSPGTKNQTAKTPDKSLTPKSQQKLDDQMQGASSPTNHDSDGNLIEENPKAPTSKFPQEVKIMYNRRMRVPWTEEEVEVLKEGMKRFASKNVTLIPWSTILEFGSTVFWKGRTGVDLKDKWRNMVKANPELRQG